MTLLAILTAVTRYRHIVSDLGSAPIDIEQGREIIRSVADPTPVRPGADGVPIAELSRMRKCRSPRSPATDTCDRNGPTDEW